MRNVTVRFVALTLCLSFAAVNAAGQNAEQPETQTDKYGRWKNGVTEDWFFELGEKYRSEDVATAQKLWNEIEKQSNNAGDEWAGVYSIAEGEVNMSYLRWSPQHGFVRFHIYTCLPAVRGLDYGKVVVSEDHVELVSSRASETENSEESPTKYVKVKWGERHYLVAENDIESFFTYTSGRGSLPYTDAGVPIDFWGRIDDSAKPIADVPVVPSAYAEHVKKPIDTRIIKVGRSYTEVDPDNDVWLDHVTPVTLNAGSNAGLKRGMTLHVVKSEDYETVVLTRVGRNYALGIIVRSMRKPGVPLVEFEPNIKRDYPPIEVGWQVSTSPHKQ